MDRHRTSPRFRPGRVRIIPSPPIPARILPASHAASSLVTATDSAIPGTTTLTCESPTYTPQGTFTVTQSSSASIIQTFTAGNGTSPYTFSSTDLPSWLVLESSAGGTSCISGQVNCLLYGTPSALGLTSFHVQLTDNLGNIACANLGCPIAVNVVAAGTEDNIYCSSSGAPAYTETVTGLSDESTAIIGTQMLQACSNTGIANTPATGGQSILVCPQGENPAARGGPWVRGSADSAPHANPARPGPAQLRHHGGNGLLRNHPGRMGDDRAIGHALRQHHQTLRNHRRHQSPERAKRLHRKRQRLRKCPVRSRSFRAL